MHRTTKTPTNSAGGPASTLQGIFPVTDGGLPGPPPTPPPVVFTVNPAVDLQVIMLNSGVGQGGYQIDPWDCATPAAAERLLSRLNGSAMNLRATIEYGFPETFAQFTGPFAQAGMVPYFLFPSNTDGSIPNPAAGLILNAAGALLEYYTEGATVDGNETADAQMIAWFKTTN